MTGQRPDRERHAVLDVVVVGAGQAALVTGYFLRRTGLAFRLFDRAARVGDSWRHRYDSLVLFSTRSYSALPGLPLDGDPNGYAGKDEVAEYLERYGRSFGLPIATGEGIARLEGRPDGFLAVTDLGQRVLAGAVIVATGAFQQSAVPAFATRLHDNITQLTAGSYRHARQVPEGPVLVVGGGATGRQIADELARSHQVSLSTGRPMMITPQRVLGRDVMAWFDTLGFLRADRDTARGRLARARQSFPGLHLRSRALRGRGVRLRPRLVGAEGERCCFADGSSDVFDTVIWAIGYRDETSWLHLDGAADGSGNYVQERGRSPVPRLFHVGRSWQTSRASALLCGVSADAEDIVRQVTKTLVAA